MSNLSKPIPEEIALQICEEVREHNKKKKLSFAKFLMLNTKKHNSVNLLIYPLRKFSSNYSFIFIPL